MLKNVIKLRLIVGLERLTSLFFSDSKFANTTTVFLIQMIKNKKTRASKLDGFFMFSLIT